MQSVILAIDEGTSNAKAITLDQGGNILSQSATPLVVSHPQPAWCEQDPNAIIDAVRKCVKGAVNGAFEIIGIGISNQRESVLVWDRKTGRALSPIAVWQCRRSEPFCKELSGLDVADRIQEKTGLPIDPLFPAAKIRWLLDHLENGAARAASGEICVGTIDAWLVWNLSGQTAFVTDMSNAARTQLFNIHEQEWDRELCDIFGVPMACLPEVKSSTGCRAVTKGFDGIPDGVPIVSQIGDSHAALYGQGGFENGMIKATYGTGSSLMTPVSAVRSGDYRLASTLAWHDGAVAYGLEGNITHTGAGAAYIGKLIGENDIQALSQLAQNTSSDGVYFVPALSGLGAPHWKSAARGMITGLTDAANRAQLARAGFEAIAFQVADVFHLMEEMSGQSLERLLVDGGPTKNTWLMQFQANVINRPVVRNGIAEISALGAGYLAGMAIGWWPSRKDLAALSREVDIIEPDKNKKMVQDVYEGWKTAVRQTLAGL